MSPAAKVLASANSQVKQSAEQGAPSAPVAKLDDDGGNIFDAVSRMSANAAIAAASQEEEYYRQALAAQGIVIGKPVPVALHTARAQT